MDINEIDEVYYRKHLALVSQQVRVESDVRDEQSGFETWDFIILTVCLSRYVLYTSLSCLTQLSAKTSFTALITLLTTGEP